MERKVVLVTGSSRGIGRATIIKFAKEGYNVAIDYIPSEREAELKLVDGDFEFDNEKDVAELKQYVEETYGVSALLVKADVSNEEEVKRGISSIINTFGRLDVVVNCAGIVFDRDIDDVTKEEWENTLNVDVYGAFLVSREASKYMNDGGAIINISSTNGTKVISPESIDYNIAKVGLQALTRDLAYRFSPIIRVNALAIGWADTDMNKDMPRDVLENEAQKIYLKRFADPNEIAETVYFLASPEAGYINGEVLTIDGGYN